MCIRDSDDTNYGIGWEGDEGRSDVKSVCGDYPAVISFEMCIRDRTGLHLPLTYKMRLVFLRSIILLSEIRVMLVARPQ